MSSSKITIIKTIKPVTIPISLQEIENSLLTNLEGSDFIPTREHGEQLENIRKKLSDEYKKSIQNFYLLPEVSESKERNALLLLTKKELILLQNREAPFNIPYNLETTLLQRYEAIRKGIQKEYEYLYQVESGKGIMSLGGLIVHPMSKKAEIRLKENFAKLENISLEESEKICTSYLNDRYRFVRHLPHEGNIDAYINIEGGRKDARDMLSYYKKLLEIKNNPLYEKINKYANIPNYDDLFFDRNLHSLDPRYEYCKFIK